MKKGLWEKVVDRDARYIWRNVISEMPMTATTYARWRAFASPICLVPVLEPDNPRPCAGKQTVDHVKDAPRLGKKAPDDEQHLVAMCEAHNVWYPPSRALRQAEREYLRKHVSVDEDR